MIIPQYFNYARTFYCRQQFLREPDGRWTPVAPEVSLHEQVNAWVEQEQVQLTVINSPTVTVIRDNADAREYLLALAVLYIPATEGDEDAITRAPDSAVSRDELDGVLGTITSQNAAEDTGPEKDPAPS